MRLKPMAMSCAFVVSAALASGAEAGIVGYWNLNGVDPAAGTVLAASQGNGSLDFTSFGTGASVFGGTEVNAPDGVPAGDALGLTGQSFNGAFALVTLSTAGIQDLELSFAMRRSSTGFGDNRVEAWIGNAWSVVGTFSGSSTAWTTITMNLASFDALENGTASLRIVFAGATSGLGTARFDNLTVSGTPVPAPGALALLAAAGCIGRRRRCTT
jgi:hypothetical protein